jgi:hypothetical protein
MLATAWPTDTFVAPAFAIVAPFCYRFAGFPAVQDVYLKHGYSAVKVRFEVISIAVLGR